MRKATLVFLLAIAASSMAFADSWTGKLLDASCYDRSHDSKQSPSAESCTATSQSSAFVLESQGKVFRLDAAGNTRAAAAIRSRADRTAPGQATPGQSALRDVMAKVDGNEAAGTITVTAIDVQ